MERKSKKEEPQSILIPVDQMDFSHPALKEPISEESRALLKSVYAHDSSGNPLPEFIRNGSVAYVPMIPSPEWERRRKLTLAPNWKPPQ